MDKTVPKKPRKISDNQKVITKFVNIEGNVDKYFFSRENALAKRLIIKYGLDFLLWIPLPYGSRVNTLRQLLTQEAEVYLESSIFEFKKETMDLTHKVEQVELLPDKVGEDTVIKQEPKTLKDFLNLYGNKRN